MFIRIVNRWRARTRWHRGLVEPQLSQGFIHLEKRGYSTQALQVPRHSSGVEAPPGSSLPLFDLINEIDDDRPALRSDHDIGGCQVPVNNTDAV